MIKKTVMNLSNSELDCTFSILSSYMTCIQQLFIIYISLPLGITSNNDRLHILPVLIDQRPGIKIFYKDNSLNQFFLHKSYY